MEKEVVTITSTKEEGESLLQKMFTSSDCFDVTLVSGDGQQVFAHKAVLSMCRFKEQSFAVCLVVAKVIQTCSFAQPPLGLSNRLWSGGTSRISPFSSGRGILCARFVLG